MGTCLEGRLIRSHSCPSSFGRGAVGPKKANLGLVSKTKMLSNCPANVWLDARHPENMRDWLPVRGSVKLGPRPGQDCRSLQHDIIRNDTFLLR